MKNNELNISHVTDVVSSSRNEERRRADLHHRFAFLLADGFDDTTVSEMKQALLTAGAMPKTIAPTVRTCYRS